MFEKFRDKAAKDLIDTFAETRKDIDIYHKASEQLSESNRNWRNDLDKVFEADRIEINENKKQALLKLIEVQKDSIAQVKRRIKDLLSQVNPDDSTRQQIVENLKRITEINSELSENMLKLERLTQDT